MDEADGFTWPDVTVNAPKEDYTVSCSGFGHYGTGTVVVKGRYNCTGIVKKVFEMQPISFESGAFKVSLDTSKTYEYYEMAWEPKVTVTWYREDGSVYRELSSAEYDVTYENNREVGTAKVIVEGDGHFTGKLETSFEIVRKDISEDTQLKQALSRTWKAYYTGEAVIPTIPGINYFNEYIPDTGYVLDEDYTMTVTDNVNAGTGTITLEGIGNYTGSMTQTFTIAPKEITQEELYVKEKTVAYAGEVIEPEVVAGELVPGVDFRVSCYRKEYDETGENYEYVLAQPQEVGVYFLKVELLNPNYLFWYSETEKEMTYYIEAASVIPPGSGDTGNTGNEDGNTSNGGNTDSDTGNGGGTFSGTESGGTAGDTSNGDTSGNAAGGTTSGGNDSGNPEDGIGKDDTKDPEDESQTGENNTSENDTPGSEQTANQTLSVGTQITDASTKNVYKILTTGTTGNTVAFVKSGNKDSKTVKIANTVTVDGITYQITAIADNAFKNYKKLSKITIGSNVTKIGKNAFANCKKLATVTLGKNVTTIGDKAFYKCTALKKITLPSKVSKIGKQAFYGCKKLKTITIKTTRLTKKNVGSKAFKGTPKNAKVKVPKKKLKAYKKLLISKGIYKKAKIK